MKEKVVDIMKKIGFIGAGNMATAIIKGMIESKEISGNDLWASDIDAKKLEALSSTYGLHTSLDNQVIAQEVDILFLAVKPFLLEQVISSIKEVVRHDQVIVSIAAGKSISLIEDMFGQPMKIIRVMPNTPALVKEGMSAIAYHESVTQEEVTWVHHIFNTLGRAEIVNESLIEAIGAVSGASPAYVYMFIEALGDAGVKAGLSRSQAYTFAAQSVLGSAKMVLETGMHPGALKDMVTSPRGSTIEGVEALEKEGFRYAVMHAVDQCLKKTEKMREE